LPAKVSLTQIALRRLCLGLLIAAAVGCTRDPEVLKRNDLERGDKFVTEKKYSEAVIEYSRALQRDPTFADAYVRIARVHIHEGNLDRARLFMQRASNAAPDNVDVQLEAGAVSLLARRFDEARRLADRVLEKEPKNVRALVLRANSLVGLEDIDTAIRLVQDAVRMTPDEPDLYSNLASLQASTGDLEEAEKTYLQAIEMAPKNVDAYLPIANFYWATGRLGQAERTFLKALEIDPKHPQAHRALATFYLGSGQALKAEESLKFVADSLGTIDHKIALGDYYLLTGRTAQGMAILTEAANDPRGAANARTRIVAATYAAGRRDEARKALDDVLKAFPEHAEALLLQARFEVDAGQYDNALKLAIRAAGLKDNYIEAMYLVGQLYARDGNIFQASETYRKILAVNPFARRAKIELSRALYARGEVESSNELMGQVLDRASSDLTIQVGLIRALLERRDLTRAEGLLNEAARAYPRSPTVLGLYGSLYALKRDYPSSRRLYQAALAANPDHIDSASGLIGLDLQQGNRQAALGRAQGLAARDPKNPAYLQLLAQTYAATAQVDNAEETLRDVIELDPTRFEAYAMLGQLLYSRGKLAEGKAEFERVLEKRPNSIGARTMVAIILRKQGRTDDAVEHYKKVIEIDAEAPVASNNLAWIYAEQGVNLDLAVILAKVARKQLPELAEVADTLGWVYHRNGHPNLVKLAVPLLQEAAQKEPNNPLFRYHLGAVLARSGRPAEARAELQAALKLSPDFHGAAETRKVLASLQ
jgi:tetratricopeptide (TPR) repeat protein